MSLPRATVCLSFDFDALSVWIGPRGAQSPSATSRGEFAVVGVQRVLKVLAARGIQATFYIPGHTVETYPAAVHQILAAGHEIGHHGYLHENPVSLPTRDEERRVIERGLKAISDVAGIAPVGYRSPSWDNSPHTIELLLEYGFRYESSLMADDFTPYWCRVGDVLHTDRAAEFGQTVDLVEMPVSWVLDDFPHFEFVRSGNNLFPGLSAASKVEEIWRDEFAFMYREVPHGVYTLTMHPEIIGRGHRMLMLERLIEWMTGHEGVEFARIGDVAEAWRNSADAPSRQRSDVDA
ncbi:MAG: polysaccharide deacetylase [Chloroflexota bacterium]|nr:polysaccharide deacetylase [Chloroflexota bacterium]